MSDGAPAAALAPLLDELQGGLEGLLSCFETRRFPEQAEMEAAWARVQCSFERVSTHLDRLGPEREALQERVDRCLRLYAVAASVLVQRRAELAAERAECSNARQRLRHAGGDGARGGSCDVNA